MAPKGNGRVGDLTLLAVLVLIVVLIVIVIANAS